ncbi:hypothetical protein [Geotalea sp. SG265]|uniref:hypothetical protein n=1 Tax=Geotalea sp. SG265 TaxID=2922867 RepID=UPI001FAF56EA|nr:hypothetical protein [Geotalea sp. SG265]
MGITSGLWTTIKAVGGFIGVISALIAALYGVNSYIDNRIKKKISDPEFIREVAAVLRPAIVFDNHERILADQGGLRFIQSIKVVRQGEAAVPSEIIVTPKEFLAVPPLLESLDLDETDIEAERGQGLSWIFKLKVQKYVMGEVKIVRFRLEILK